MVEWLKANVNQPGKEKDSLEKSERFEFPEQSSAMELI